MGSVSALVRGEGVLGEASSSRDCARSSSRRVASMLDVEPIVPSPPARVTAAARRPPALPAMGALMIRGLEIQGRDSFRSGMVGGHVGEILVWMLGLLGSGGGGMLYKYVCMYVWVWRAGEGGGKRDVQRR